MSKISKLTTNFPNLVSPVCLSVFLLVDVGKIDSMNRPNVVRKFVCYLLT